MGDDNRNCPECGGSDGFHFDDCSYDGTDGFDEYSFRSRGKSDVSTGKVWFLIILALIIGYGINEVLGSILMIGIIFWMCVSK